MRKDVADKYAEMLAAPQKIIFSDQPDGPQEELIPARITSKGQEVYDAVGDDDGFQLGADVASKFQQPANAEQADEFQLDAVQPAPIQQIGSSTAPAPDTDHSTPAAEIKEVAEASEAPANENAASEQAAVEPADSPDKKDLNSEDFLGLALSEAKETQQRKRRKLEQSRRRRILVPCSTCGAWIRVHQDQAGRTVRCQKCKTPFVVPQIKKKEKPQGDKTKAAGFTVDWLEDVSMHVVNPTDIVLKPGSLEKDTQPADITFHDGQMHVIKFAPPEKKGLFGKANDQTSVSGQRKQIREAIGRAGNIDSIPVGECFLVAAAQASNLKLVQPVAEAHASMFAGVPVFGTGKIAVYLPIAQADNQQIFLSLTLTQCRQLAAELKQHFQIDLQLAENGVPATEQKDMLKCKLLEVPVEAIRNIEYYENDSAFELEMTGYRCGTCQAVISEEGRLRKKLGGAAGKGIAKAKCPSCAAKMGNHKTYRIGKQPTQQNEQQDDQPAPE